MIIEHGVSERQACKAVELPRSTYQYIRNHCARNWFTTAISSRW
ncbi:unnamed protein product, partial [marine sediment metagenome]